jgi:hypothetical protein
MILRPKAFGQLIRASRGHMQARAYPGEKPPETGRFEPPVPEAAMVAAQ